MKHNIVDNLFAGASSLVLHVVLFAMFIIGMDLTSTPKPLAQEPQKEIVQATVLDETLVEEEVARLEKLEQEKKNAEKER